MIVILFSPEFDLLLFFFFSLNIVFLANWKKGGFDSIDSDVSM